MSNTPSDAAGASPALPEDPLDRIRHLWDRQMSVMYAGSQVADRSPRVDPASLPLEDRTPDAFKRLGHEIDLAVREAHDGSRIRAGLSVSAIYNATPLSRNEIKRALEATKPAAAADTSRANELAAQTHIYGLAKQTAALMVNALMDAETNAQASGEPHEATDDGGKSVAEGGTQVAARLRSKYLAFFGEWRKAQTREWVDDPDAQAILSALTTLVRDCLSPESIDQQAANRRRWSPDPRWRRRNW